MAFSSATYESRIVNTLREQYPTWAAGIAVYGGDYEVVLDDKQQTIVTVWEYEYAPPEAAPNHPTNLANGYVKITGKIFLSEPLTDNMALFRLKTRVENLSAILPLIGVEGQLQPGIIPIRATPVDVRGSAICAYEMTFEDIVEASSAHEIVEPTAPITQVRFDIQATLAP